MTPGAWALVKLGDHCEVFSGYPFKSSGFTDDPDDIPLVKGENVGQGEILWKISKRWRRSDVDELQRFRLLPGDVVLAMDRPWVPAGLKFARISEAVPEALLVTLPPETLMRRFGEIAKASFQQRETLALQNQRLKAARDLLLPRLMSGEIAV